MTHLELVREDNIVQLRRGTNGEQSGSGVTSSDPRRSPRTPSTFDEAQYRDLLVAVQLLRRHRRDQRPLDKIEDELKAAVYRLNYGLDGAA